MIFAVVRFLRDVHHIVTGGVGHFGCKLRRQGDLEVFSVDEHPTVAARPTICM